MFTINKQLALAGSSLLLLLAGCSGTPDYPPAPVQASAADWNYLIGPGDSVQVFVWRNPEVSGSFPVRPDGKMTMNLVEDMQASGKTPSQLARDIEKSLAKYIQEPIVTVIVAGGVGPFDQQIRVLGEAAKPQALNYREKMSLVDLMIQVGGLTDFAAGNKAYILRNVDGKQQQLGVRLEDLVRDGDISANVDMRPGDVLVVPESLF
ncbi:MAG: sugar ABC transporter substrate-binding protein [Hydrogenophilales bacterium 16-64-46]|nr:MAG: sugar ABC transporter substrate-binding protein [Hydrogenophilales bacterium 12-64-13]OYZ07214.1 MAG: sugar ABC transporter substrate-binding protein [Hydrogenophilales bacterium 16-64-46]OZA37318.1 MAG: sugar ABC transporter substrate-binding protein [Hydrogenophilales bacterium 17-64-34]HQS98929.1 polysaccharide export protein [Thiobacillus sp.]